MRSVLVVIVCLALSGCVSAEAIKQARVNAALNWAHADDESLPDEARLIGQTNAVAWEAQVRALDGTPISDRAAAVLEVEDD